MPAALQKFDALRDASGSSEANETCTVKDPTGGVMVAVTVDISNPVPAESGTAGDAQSVRKRSRRIRDCRRET